MEGGDNEMIAAMGIGGFGKQKKIPMGPPKIQEEGVRPMVSS
jgi:hypothetical protein